MLEIMKVFSIGGELLYLQYGLGDAQHIVKKLNTGKLLNHIGDFTLG